MVAFPCNEQDVQLWVLLARKYGLSMNAFGTGHEFLNRHMSQNLSLAIRTGIIRDVEFNLNTTNRFNHPPGTVRVGAGLKFGELHQQCHDQSRVCVSGHAPSVGVVGWFTGGGHGLIAPQFGMGVDNVAEVELVAADGSLVVANANGTRYQLPGAEEWNSTTDNSLFWAIRGGGGSSWGVVTHVTYFVHYPPDGIQNVNTLYVGRKEHFSDAITGFGKWTATLGPKWSYYTTIAKFGQQPCLNDDAAAIAAVGMTCDALVKFLNLTAVDYCSVATLNMTACATIPTCIADPAAAALSIATSSCKKACDSCWDWGITGTIYYLGLNTDTEYTEKKETFVQSLPPTAHQLSASEVDYGQDYLTLCMQDTYEGITPEWNLNFRIPQVNVAKDVLNSSSWASALTEMTQTAYDKNYTTSFTMYKTLADGLKPEYSSPNALAPGFRKAAIWLGVGMSANPGGQYPQGLDSATDEIILPAMYKLGNSSYFSESDYKLDKWKERYWGNDIAAKLETVKATWDPELVFTCRHCIGDGMTPKCGDETSLPPRTSCLASVRQSEMDSAAISV